MKEVRSRRTITISEVRDILDNVDPEKIDQLQKRTKDYVEKFAKLETKAAQEAVKRLVKECNLTTEEATELVNILPKTNAELRVFTAGWKKLLPAETVEKIFSILKEAA